MGWESDGTGDLAVVVESEENLDEELDGNCAQEKRRDDELKGKIANVHRQSNSLRTSVCNLPARCYSRRRRNIVRIHWRRGWWCRSFWQLLWRRGREGW